MDVFFDVFLLQNKMVVQGTLASSNSFMRLTHVLTLVRNKKESK